MCTPCLFVHILCWNYDQIILIKHENMLKLNMYPKVCWFRYQQKMCTCTLRAKSYLENGLMDYTSTQKQNKPNNATKITQLNFSPPFHAWSSFWMRAWLATITARKCVEMIMGRVMYKYFLYFHPKNLKAKLHSNLYSSMSNTSVTLIWN